MTWIAFYIALGAASWAAVWPMLREPRAALKWDAPIVDFDVPVATYDSRGMT